MIEGASDDPLAMTTLNNGDDEMINPSLISEVANSRRLQAYLTAAEEITCSNPGGDNKISFEDFAKSRYLFLTGYDWHELTYTLTLYYMEYNESAKKLVDNEIEAAITR